MDEKINTEAVQGDESVAETPTQQGSTPEAQPSPVDEESLKALVEPIIQAEVEKRVDSYKDKRIAKLSSETKSLKESLAEVKELQAEGMSEKQAIQYIETQKLLDAQGQEVPTDAPPEGEPAVQPTVAGEEYLSSVLKMSGLTDSDPDVIELLRKERDPFKRIAAIGELAETRKQAQTTPARAGATLPSGAGETVPAEESLETITEQLNAELAKPKKDFQKLKELGKKHKELLPTE